jgi:hypothetical protein
MRIMIAGICIHKPKYFNKLLWFFLFFASNNIAYVQSQHDLQITDVDSIVLFVNNKSYHSDEHTVVVNDKHHIAFISHSDNQVVSGRVYTNMDKIWEMELMDSPDFEILENTQCIQNTYYSFKIKFTNVSSSDQLKLQFLAYNKTGDDWVFEMPLYTHLPMYVDFHPGSEEFFMGESRKFELMTNQISNLAIDGYWKSDGVFNYRLERDQNKAYIYLEPTQSGDQSFQISFETIRPVLDKNNVLSNKLPTLNKRVFVKDQRIAFLKFDERLVVRDLFKANRHTVTVSSHKLLDLNRTYRLEASENPGATLIAELIPWRNLSNDKVECEIRTYNNHLLSDGNVYVKYDGNVLFITNIEVIPSPIINKVSILKPGEEWTTNLTVRPGDIFRVRIQGKYLGDSRFYFDELYDLKSDSFQNTADVVYYHLMVPIHISKKEIKILLNQEETNFNIFVVEHNKPRSLDFLTLDYGRGPISTEEINQAILYPRTVSDLVISFDPSKIDSEDQLYGRQHLRFSVRMEDRNGRVLETSIIGSFFFCPGESSPRYPFYNKTQCRMDEIRLNDFLRMKTYSLTEWGKIEVNIQHVGTSYDTEGYFKSIVIYNEKRLSFDVDVSVPAGLFIQTLGRDEPIASLSGISFAMIAQFSFYKRGEIKKELPIKAGAGFIAKNALNFNPEADRDLGVIAIASVYPIPGTNRISFPLYAGLGYFLQENKFFALIGPGIRVTF